MKENLEEESVPKYINVKQILFIIIMIGLIIIGPVRTFLWEKYMTRFDPYLESENLIQTSLIANHELSPNHSRRTYRDIFGSNYRYEVELPPRLKYGGRIRILDETKDYTLELIIWMSGSWLNPDRQSYTMSIADLTGISRTSRAAAVDKNGQPLGPHPDDREDYYEIWLARYEKYNGQIMEMFEIVKKVYGENVIK